MSLTSQPQPQSEGRSYPETVIEDFWPSRIKHDRVWYSQFVSEGSRFLITSEYADHPHHIYRITDIEHRGDTFTLEPCGVSTPADGQQSPITQSYYVSNICELAGALELGELVHLPSGALRVVDDTSYITIGETTIAVGTDGPDAQQMLRHVDPLSGTAPITEDGITDVATGIDADVSVFIPQSAVEKPVTDYYSVQPFSKWTFEDDTIRSWVESHYGPGDKVLNACAGKVHLSEPEGDGEIIRADINEDRDADIHADVAELAAHLELESFDAIIFDPPWSMYQSSLRYEGAHVTKDPDDGIPTSVDLSILPFDTPDAAEKTQLGHAALAKKGFHHLLAPNGEVIQITFHGTAMPARLKYQREERVIFNPVGEAKSVIGSVDRKTAASEAVDCLTTDATQSSDTQQSLERFMS